MTVTPTSLDDYAAIAETFEIYIAGAKSGKSADLRAAFHADAMIHGYVGEELFAGPIQNFYEWHDDNGPATGLEARITSMDVIGTVATARVELDDWTGHRFSDLFTLLKVDGKWLIISKVFHMHA
jgi:hypothetical protein